MKDEPAEAFGRSHQKPLHLTFEGLADGGAACVSSPPATERPDPELPMKISTKAQCLFVALEPKPNGITVADRRLASPPAAAKPLVRCCGSKDRIKAIYKTHSE